jgi:hypothetical protein
MRVLTKQAPVTEVDWTYATCPLNADAAGFGPFAGLVATWQSRTTPQRPLPSRADFDMIDFAGWLGRVFIAKIEHDPFTLRFTLWGTELAEWWGVDYTGKRLGEASFTPEAWEPTELAYFAEMDRAPFLGIASGYLSQHGRSFIKIAGLDLPCSDGAGLSHVISIHLRMHPEESIRQLLPDCPMVPYGS